jgi:hypothetical protein
MPSDPNSPTKSPELTTSRQSRVPTVPPLVRNGELARFLVKYQKATPEERPALEAEYDRLFPPDQKDPAV